tara:strand:- start:38400 stop:39494 length:1095 start_codon:yes stop_codon:yes gene_type:complete
MAICYVDPVTGLDDVGTAGTAGDPYASIDYAEANHTLSTTEANTIFLANTSADVLSSVITITKATLEAPLTIEGWDNGGSLTCTLPNGRTQMCGEIDGNDAVGSIVSAEAYVTFRYIKAHSTTSYGIFLSTGGNVDSCEVYNGENRIVSASGPVTNSYIHGDSFDANDYGIFSVGPVINCEVKGADVGIYSTGVNAIITQNLIHDVRTAGIRIAGDNQQITNNTIDGDGADSSAIGIKCFSSNSENATILDNIISNWDGVSSIGIQDISGGGCREVGNNHFYNNTTDESYTHTPHQVAADVSLGTDPFENLAGDDYSLASGGAAIGAALFSNLDPDNPFNVGGWQSFAGGGGGGSGEPFYVSTS